MASIKFLIKSKINPATIYIRFFNGRKFDFVCATNLVINIENWSVLKQKPKNTKSEAMYKLDCDLQILRTNLINYYNNSKETISLPWLKNFINPEVKKELTEYLVSYFDYYLLDRKSELDIRHVQRINGIKKKLEKFEVEIKKSFLIKDIGPYFRNDFIKWNEKNNYSENTIFSNLKQIKNICYHAQKKGLEINSEISEIKIIQKKAISIYLTFEDIEKISQKDFKIQILDCVRDWLVISCFTGQRVSDFLRFTKSMIREQNGTQLIEFTQKKTNKVMTLPLHPKVIAILNKRGGEFPSKMPEQIYNKMIKNVCKKVGFDELVYGGKIDITMGRKVLKMYPKHELVTSHIGRRSFATNHYGKIPTPLLMSATGHTTEKTFLVYIGKSDAEKAMQLSEWF